MRLSGVQIIPAGLLDSVPDGLRDYASRLEQDLRRKFQAIADAVNANEARTLVLPNVAERPTASEKWRGVLVTIIDPGGGADLTQICEWDGAAFSWRTL